jgi:hypothetical protein
LFARKRAKGGPLAIGDYVIAHGRFSGHGRSAAWIAADVVRFEDGKLAEHWDVLQDEANEAESVSACRCSATVSRPDRAVLKIKASRRTMKLSGNTILIITYLVSPAAGSRPIKTLYVRDKCVRAMRQPAARTDARRRRSPRGSS